MIISLRIYKVIHHSRVFAESRLIVHYFSIYWWVRRHNAVVGNILVRIFRLEIVLVSNVWVDNLRWLWWSISAPCHKHNDHGPTPGHLQQIRLVAWSAPSHYLNQCWNIISSNIRNKLTWNLNRNSNTFINKNAFKFVVCEMADILSWIQCAALRPTNRSSKPRDWVLGCIDHWDFCGDVVEVPAKSTSNQAIKYHISHVFENWWLVRVIDRGPWFNSNIPNRRKSPRESHSSYTYQNTTYW